MATVSHLWSNHEIIAHAYVPSKVLGMHKVWRESVQGRQRYRFHHTHTQTDGRMDRRITKIFHVHDVLSIREVWSELLQACPRYSSIHAFSQSKWPPVGHLWSNHEIIALAYVPGKVLGMYKVWRESVQGRPRYRFGQTHTQTDEWTKIDNKNIACTYIC